MAMNEKMFKTNNCSRIQKFKYKKFYKWKSHMVRNRYVTKRSWYELGFHMVGNGHGTKQLE